MNTALELVSYFFPHISVSADPQFQGKGPLALPACEVKTTVERDDGRNLYQVAVEILSDAEPDKQPYSFHLVGIGIFRVDPSWPDPGKLLKVNGSSIIYSAAREFLITVTSRGPWGKIILPTISFLPAKEEAKGSTPSMTGKKKAAPKKKTATPTKK